ncbi:hypothetical protein HPP92_016855 [Vanilla planifolia]|uniref:Uncharacterized protein n=1 Tax=Vanilla planifolia TaxID=51239 RepID=A0A835QGW5_VANPL|nr:hypothetical protein HPP92_016855 [Vanilla planifolia]
MALQRSTEPRAIRNSVSDDWKPHQPPANNNNIKGEIPTELGLLSKLQTMDLSNNGFIRSIPSLWVD